MVHRSRRFTGGSASGRGGRAAAAGGVGRQQQDEDTLSFGIWRVTYVRAYRASPPNPYPFPLFPILARKDGDPIGLRERTIELRVMQSDNAVHGRPVTLTCLGVSVLC